MSTSTNASAGGLPAEEAVFEVTSHLHGTDTFVVGSAVAGRGYEDVDVFTPSQPMLFATVQSMLDRGYTLDDKFDRVWHRWLKYGLKGWHTNSIKLHTLNDVPVNVVLKYVDGHPTTSLAQVLESFDFGLLAQGWDMRTSTFRSMKSYLFPGLDPDGPLPLMPNKRDDWVHGFISKYNGLREGYRYAKYCNYGYDMSAVGPDLVTGYRNAALYHKDQFEEEKQMLGDIYNIIADHIEWGTIDELTKSYKELDFSDPLSEIMEALQ